MTDYEKRPRHTLIRGVVGSTAYGLAREGSDVDRLEVFAWPTDAFWHLGAMPETMGQQSPDNPDSFPKHEVGKYVHLALKCNPTILEMLWLPMEHVEHLSPLGQQLRDIRLFFLSEPYVRNAYGGYARQQLDRLVRRTAEGKDGFSSDTKKRTAKHARHCFRLLTQGRELLERGEIQVRVDDPETYWAFDDMTVDEIVQAFTEADLRFRQTKTVLPESPDYLRVDAFLYGVRRTLLEWQSLG